MKKATTNISTNKDQSERLIRCGVCAETADMVWRKNYDPCSESDNTKSEQLCVMSYNTARILYGENFVTPTWSLSRLLAFMPTTIQKGKAVYYLDFVPYGNKGWGFGYFNGDGIRTIKGLTQPSDPIEASVCLIEWLNSNGYELNEDNFKKFEI